MKKEKSEKASIFKVPPNPISHPTVMLPGKTLPKVLLPQKKFQT